MTVKGCGTVEVNTTGAHAQLPADLQHTCLSNATLSVTESATLKINEGRKITGNGTISLAADTTLAIDNGTNRTFELADYIPGLALPESGTATLCIDGSRLKGGVDYVLMDAAPDGWSAADPHLTVTGTALGSRNYEVTVKDGALVLDIQPDGLMVIFK